MGWDDEKNNKTEDFVIMNQSLYCLSPSNSPGAVIIAVKFDGKHYDMWEQAVRIALKAKNKLSFIDGKITKLEVNEGEVSAEANA